mmetsp:Transcript_69538/g.166735  ORF Transcript_69538/g.166735 Transcript_69538/m.166735 type:complete len:184 (+) Transcript_69538:73-624(+)
MLVAEPTHAGGSIGTRKRSAGASCVGLNTVAAAASASTCKHFSERRLPAHTMVYCTLEGDASFPTEGTLFHLHEGVLRQQSPLPRVWQFKPDGFLRLLEASSSDIAGPSAMLGSPYGLLESMAELRSEAEARSLDGILLPSGGVCLLRPQERLLLIDDDKQEGCTQQLLSDMFSLMSINENTR